MTMKRLIRRLTAPAALAAAMLLAAWGPMAVPVLAASQPNITPSTVQIVPPGTTYPDVSGTLLDQYGNPIGGASLSLTMENATSGATPATLGPFTGTTNSNGQFSIQVTPGAVGQFYPQIVATNQYGSATFTYPNDLLNVTEYPPSTIYEWAVYGSNGPQNTSNVTPSTFTGQLYPIAAQLVNDTGTPINGVDVTVSVPTDPGATVMALPPSCLETSSGCSSTESGTGSLQQTTGTYAANSGEVGVDVIFTQPGQQTIQVTYDNTVQTLTVTVYPGAVAQITGWSVDTGNYADAGGSPVGGTVQAGTALYVSGTAVNSDGQQVPAGTQIVVEMPGGNAAPVTTYTVQTAGGSGYFQAELTPTAAGSWWVEAQASGSTFQDVDLGVTAGNPAMGYTVVWNPPAIVAPNATFGNFGGELTDQYGNGIGGVQATLTCTSLPPGTYAYDTGPTTASYTTNGTGSCPSVGGTTPTNVSGGFGINITPGSPSSGSSYALEFAAAFPGTSGVTVKNSQIIIVSDNWPTSVEYANLTISDYGGGGAPLSSTPYWTQSFSSSPINVTAGDKISIQGEILNANTGVPVPNDMVWINLDGNSVIGLTTNADGVFSTPLNVVFAGSGTYLQNISVAGTQDVISAGIQQLNVSPDNPTMQLAITLNTPSSPVTGVYYGTGVGAPLRIEVQVIDQYGNPVQASVTFFTPTEVWLESTGAVQNGWSQTVTAGPDGMAIGGPVWFVHNGSWPITVTAAYGGASTSKTVYFDAQ